MRPFSRAFFILAIAAITMSCESPDQDADLKRQLEQQANSRPPRAAMSFGYIHELDRIDEGGPVSVTSDSGTQIEIQEAYLVISAVEAHLCEPELATNSPAEHGFWRSIEPFFIAQAHAHVPSSATRLGTPFVEDLLAPGRARIVGEISPPLGKYCRLFAVVSPADDDVLNLSDLESADIFGKSLLLRGRWRESADAAWQPFSSASRARRAVELEAIDPNTGRQPLTLDEPSQTKMLLIDKTITPEIFEDLADGVSPENNQLRSSAAADLVLEGIEDELRIRNFKSNSQNP